VSSRSSDGSLPPHALEGPRSSCASLVGLGFSRLHGSPEFYLLSHHTTASESTARRCGQAENFRAVWRTRAQRDTENPRYICCTCACKVPDILDVMILQCHAGKWGSTKCDRNRVASIAAYDSEAISFHRQRSQQNSVLPPAVDLGCSESDAHAALDRRAKCPETNTAHHLMHTSR
jgi:hypothetical protein